MRRRGEQAGFDKAHPVYDDSLLPKMTVDAKELQLVKDVRQMLEGENGAASQLLFTEENICTHVAN